MIGIFALAGPFGIVLGILLSGLGDKAAAIVMSCATGNPLGLSLFWVQNRDFSLHRLLGAGR